MHRRVLNALIASCTAIAAVSCSSDGSDARPTTTNGAEQTTTGPATTDPAAPPAIDPTAPTTTNPPDRDPRAQLVLRDDAVELIRFEDAVDPYPIGVYLAVSGQSVDVSIHRDDYLTTPAASIARTIDGTTTVTDISPTLGFDNTGFVTAARLDVLDQSGELVTATDLSWCPIDEERFDQSGTLIAGRRGFGCSWFDDLGFGTRWGVSDGWGSQLSIPDPGKLDLPDGSYTASVTLSDTLSKVLNAPTTPAVFDLIVRDATDEELFEYAAQNGEPTEPVVEEFFDENGAPIVLDSSGALTVFDADGHPLTIDAYGNRVEIDEFGNLLYVNEISDDPSYVDSAFIPPVGTPVEPGEHPLRPAVDAKLIPDGAALPDLRVYPSHDIRIVTEPEGRDFLAFASTTWNAGRGTMMIEGFRRTGQAGMDAFQILTDGTKQVAALPAGTLEYHKGDGHDHWHLLDFGRYELTDSAKIVVRDSGKQAWCLALTDVVDTSPLYVDLNAQAEDLGDACGSPDDMWSRQAIPPGFGDTYTPDQTGQVFDITALANGDYYIKLTANPDNVLAEEDLTNNVSFRWVVLGGEPGARTVRVPPYQGIDTENGDPDFSFGG
jgi:Lysyl oxidase